MNDLNVSVELRSSFLSENETVLKPLLNIPKYQAMQWDKIAAWLKQ